MATPSEESAAKKHTRTTSGRSSMPRRSTRGPLDISQAPVTIPVPASPSVTDMTSPRQSSISSLTPTTSTTGVPTAPLKSFPSLLRPELYHPLSTLTVAPPFRNSPYQPASTSPVAALLQAGHFRAAAIAAAQALTSSDLAPTDHAQIFSLFYIRLAALTLCGSTALAAQEATALEDLNSSAYRDDVSGMHLVPWELRVLAVRLQSVGFTDARKSVMGYYDLARDARAHILKLRAEGGNEVGMNVWEQRLSELGVRVAGALVEMEDWEGAGRQLQSLGEGNEGLGLHKALLWLKIGDLERARKSVRPGGVGEGIVKALGEVAIGNYGGAVDAWKELSEQDEANALYKQNLAVCLLYAGRMTEARAILEHLVSDGHFFNTITFNLSTIYELCTDRSRALKAGLAEEIASLDPESQGGLGWEKTLLDFKL